MPSPTKQNPPSSFDVHFYGYSELASLVLYFAAGIALLVISIQTFQSDPKDTLNSKAQDWIAATNNYQQFASPSISSAHWTASISTTAPSTTASASFALQTTSVSVHRWVPAVTSYSLKATLDIEPLLASDPPNNKVQLSLSTELNSFAIELDLNFTNRNMTMDNTNGVLCDRSGGGGVPCNKTALCMQRYGSLSKAIDADNNDWIGESGNNNLSWSCETPFYNQANCINVFRRQNDSGTFVWWPSFDIKGCEHPFSRDLFSQSTIIRTNSSSLDFYIREVNDPLLRKKIISGEATGATENTKMFDVERTDPIQPAVGIMFCAVLLLAGSFMMCLKLLPFWVGRYRSGQRVMVSLESILAEEEDEQHDELMKETD